PGADPGGVRGRGCRQGLGLDRQGREERRRGQDAPEDTCHCFSSCCGGTEVLVGVLSSFTLVASINFILEKEIFFSRLNFFLLQKATAWRCVSFLAPGGPGGLVGRRRGGGRPPPVALFQALRGAAFDEAEAQRIVLGCPEGMDTPDRFLLRLVQVPKRLQ